MSSPEPIKFTDGAAYERFMAPWSRSAGTLFLDWLAPRSGLAWVDVGAGNGAFTELLACEVRPLIRLRDRSLRRDRSRLRARKYRQSRSSFRLAMRWPFPTTRDRFDVAVMALVLFFVPDAAQRRLGNGPRHQARRHGRVLYLGHPARRHAAPSRCGKKWMALASRRCARRVRTYRVSKRSRRCGQSSVCAMIETRELVVERTFATSTTTGSRMVVSSPSGVCGKAVGRRERGAETPIAGATAGERDR